MSDDKVYHICGDPLVDAEWQARALKAEAAISDVAERSTADMIYWKDKCLNAEAERDAAWKSRHLWEGYALKYTKALREIVTEANKRKDPAWGGYDWDLIARIGEIARAALPKDKGE